MSRCTGHCCRRFPLPVSLDELRERQAQPEAPPDVVYVKPRVRDGDYLLAMLVELGQGYYLNGEPCWYYTCRHHDVHTGDCLAYDSRPWMCSAYPYGLMCTIDGCTAENRGLVQIRKPDDSIGDIHGPLP